MGQNSTRNWTAGFSPWFHFTRVTHFGYLFLTHSHVSLGTFVASDGDLPPKQGATGDESDPS